MTVTIDASAVPVTCWLWTGLSLYLFLTYLWWGPWLARQQYEREKDFWRSSADKLTAYLIWVFAPVTVPVFLVCGVAAKVANWIVFGGKS